MCSRLFFLSSAFAMALISVTAFPTPKSGDYDPAYGKPSDVVLMYNVTETKNLRSQLQMRPQERMQSLKSPQGYVRHSVRSVNPGDTNPDVPHHFNARYASCGGFCRFKFCDDENVYRIDIVDDMSFTKAICDKQGTTVGLVHETGQAHVMVDSLYGVPISNYKPSGLVTPYPEDFFKSYQIGTTLRSGVGHVTPEDNQLDYLNLRCIIVPLAKYDVMDQNDQVIDEVNPNDYPFVNCVGFQALSF